MNKGLIAGGLGLAILFQIGVLAVEYLAAVYPLWSGQPVKLATLPVDPRSLFRGNYARLRYGISTIPAAELDDARGIRNDEVIYVRLKKADDDIYGFAGASLERPNSGLFIRGRAIRSVAGDGAQLGVRYGIEAWFAPKNKAQQLERDLRQGAVAVVMIAENGRATLASIEPDPQR